MEFKDEQESQDAKSVRKKPIVKNVDFGNVGNHGNSLINDVTNVTKYTNITMLPNNYNHSNRYVILDDINNHSEGTTQREICERTGIIRENISRNLHRPDSSKGLIDRGFVEEIEGDEGKLYRITVKGREHLERYGQRLEEEEKRRHKAELTKHLEENRQGTWERFLSEQRGVEIVNRDDYKFLKLDMGFLDADLVEDFLCSPEECISRIKDILDSDFDIVPVNIPTDEAPRSLGSLRANDMGKLLSVRGIVRSVQSVKPKVVLIEYECLDCGDRQSLYQFTEKPVRPLWCHGCKKKNPSLDVVRNRKIDFQLLRLEELHEDLGGRNQVNTMFVGIGGKRLTSEEKQQRFEDSNNPIVVIGVMKDLNQFLEKKSNISDPYLVAVDVRFENVKNYDISEGDKVELRKYSPEQVIKSFAPRIYGQQEAKTGVILAYLSGGDPSKFGEDKRDDSHLLIIGDPGVAKTVISRYLQKFPNVRYVDATSASKVGLKGAVHQDPVVGYIYDKGALVLSSGGVCVIDELDKFPKDDQKTLHVPMEQQIAPVDKADKHVSPKCDTTIIALCNPEDNQFDRSRNYSEQIPFLFSVRDRFDLIIPIEDKVDEEEDRKLADHVLNDRAIADDAVMDEDKVIKYLLYARSLRPVLTDKAKAVIRERFALLRRESADTKLRRSRRLLKSMIRLSVAWAKLHLSDKVSEEHACAACDFIELTWGMLQINDGQIDVKKEKVL